MYERKVIRFEFSHELEKLSAEHLDWKLVAVSLIDRNENCVVFERDCQPKKKYLGRECLKCKYIVWSYVDVSILTTCPNCGEPDCGKESIFITTDRSIERYSEDYPPDVIRLYVASLGIE